MVEQVYIEATAPDGHAEAVAEIFKRAGFDTDVQATNESRGAGEVTTWIIQVALNDTVEGFFLALGGAAFKFFVLDLLERVAAVKVKSTWVDRNTRVLCCRPGCPRRLLTHSLTSTGKTSEAIG